MVDYWALWDYAKLFTIRHSTHMKWSVNLCFILATITMISPAVAARSIWPWTLFLIGNGIWLADSLVLGQYPWFFASIAFSLYDVLLIYSRVSGIDALWFIRPFIQQLEQYLL